MWDTKHRPLTFEDVLGQDGSIQVLRARLLEGKAFDTSYIFSGDHGCGKTTLARIMARAMLCTNLTPSGDPCNVCPNCQGCLDETLEAFTELDAASHGTTADMRDLVDGLAYAIPGIPKRIYLLDEAHRMSRDGQDVLLKAIEDKRVIIIFCTTEPAKVRGTIRSRCESYEIRKTPKSDLLKRMFRILDLEGVGYEVEAVGSVIDLSKSHVRDVLNKLETLAQVGDITQAAVAEKFNLNVSGIFFELLLALGTPAKSVELLDTLCDRMAPVDVVSGLAEASLNAYRVAKKLPFDGTASDLPLATQLYALLGDKVLELADYFLRLPYVTRNHLVCDILKLSDLKNISVVEASTTVSPPVVFRAPTALPSAPEAKPLTANNAPVTPKPPTSQHPSSSTLQKTSNTLPDVRADGVGPLGTDPRALTSVEPAAIPKAMPRDDRRASNSKPTVKIVTQDVILTPAEFGSKFLQLVDER